MRSAGRHPLSVFEKIWSAHVVARLDDGRDLIFVDRHVLQETTSAIAFDGLAKAGRRVVHPELTIATQDHIVSTAPGRDETTNPVGRELLTLMRSNAYAHRIRHFGVEDPRQGIVHIIGPELGLALPGCVLACGDSHTSTVGGIGALGIGVGTSEVEHVLATQTLALPRPKTMRIRFDGTLPDGVTAKDLILRAIGLFGIAAGQGHAIEYAGPVVAGLPVEARLTMCNMSIEIGARLGLIAPDEDTFRYVLGREFSPSGGDAETAKAYWRSLRSDDETVFDKDLTSIARTLRPRSPGGPRSRTWPASTSRCPTPRATAMPRAAPWPPMPCATWICRPVRRSPESRSTSPSSAPAPIRASPISKPPPRWCAAGGWRPTCADWSCLGRCRSNAMRRRKASTGCSSTRASNGARPGVRCASASTRTWWRPVCDASRPSNRNFENRQGLRSRTHLASPVTVAASAISGHIADARRLVRR